MATLNSWHRVSAGAGSHWPGATAKREGTREPWFVKRVLDLALSALALVMLAPVMAVIAVAIRLDSQGPVIFRSRHIGKNGNIFECLKFRSMDSQKDGGCEPAVTRVGYWLRRYGLDELPQLWNVLRGEMSLVGSRALLAGEDVPTSVRRMPLFELAPGMTGLWHVHCCHEAGFGGYISTESTYRENWSVWLDVRIIARSVADAITGSCR